MAKTADASTKLNAIHDYKQCDKVPGFKVAMDMAVANLSKAQAYVASGKAQCEFDLQDEGTSSKMLWGCKGPAALQTDYHLRVGLTAKNLATEICNTPEKLLAKP